MDSEYKSLEPEIPNGSSRSMLLKENGLILNPVRDHASGEGLPYAPVDWPNPGDVWGWRVGKRKNSHGFMADRYLYPPSRFQMNLNKKKPYFDSFQSIKEFVKREFPNADLNAFLASFSWKIPSTDYRGEKDLCNREVIAEGLGSELHCDLKCKARNKMCDLQMEARSNSLPAMACDICCTESGFCQNCCCILCSRGINWAYECYSFIRCEENVGENNICGHAAHIDCALRSYMAGTVGGSIRLDAEYYCRRCDRRTDLIPHVTRLVKTCESLDSLNDLEKILSMGLCILRGTQKENAKRLLKRIELALAKLKGGNHLKDIWNEEDNTLEASSGALPELGNNSTLFGLEDTKGQYSHEPDNILRRYQQPVYITSDHNVESLKLDSEIEQVLKDLRTSQELEYRMAQDKLNAKKHLVIDLYRQLDADRSELAKRTASTKGSDVEALLANILSKVNRIKQEVAKLKEMEEVGKGFGKALPSTLKEHFGIHVDD